MYTGDKTSGMTVSNRWIYSWQIVYDGNFSAELFKPKVPKDDIRLADGAGFMVGQDRYQAHLKVVTEIKEVGILSQLLCRID